MVKKYPIPKVYVQLRLKHPSFTIVFVGSFGCINSFSPSVEKGSGLAAVKYIYICDYQTTATSTTGSMMN